MVTTFNHRVVRKIESSRRDEKSNRGDFLIFAFLMLVKLSYARSEKPAHLREETVKCAGCRLILTTLVNPKRV